MAPKRKRHAWESESESSEPVNKHPWENDGSDADSESAGDSGADLGPPDWSDSEAESDASFEGPSPQEQAADCFLETLLSMYIMSSISAGTATTLAYWAGHAGAGAKISACGKKPGSHPSNCVKHFEKAMGLDRKNRSKNRYMLSVPGYHRHRLARGEVNLPAKNLHEALQRECEQTPDMAERLADMAPKLPPCYNAHPLTRRYGSGHVLPLALYMDYVSYANRDPCLGVWVQTSVTSVRTLVMAIKKNCM